MARPPAIRMQWRNLLFLHWPVPADALRDLVPGVFDVDEFDGSAWIALVPFTMTFRPRGVPPVPTMHRFHECNVRTYVTCNGEPGVWFLSLDAASRLAVWAARRFWRLNYVHSRITLTRDGPLSRYTVRRVRDPDTTMRCTWRVGAPRASSRPGDAAHFLTERYALFSTDRNGRPWRGPIEHAPWSLRDAELLELEDGLVPAAGITPDASTPLVWHAERLDVKAWPLRRI